MVDSDSNSALPIGGVFQYGLQIRWGDLDAQNHVNNTSYFRFQEEARVQLFMQAGIFSADRQGVLVHASCDFLQPLFYPADVLVSLVLTKIGRSSLAFDTRIEVQGQLGKVYATGHNVMVSVDAATGRTIPWQAQDLARLAAAFRLDT